MQVTVVESSIRYRSYPRGNIHTAKRIAVVEYTVRNISPVCYIFLITPLGNAIGDNDGLKRRTFIKSSTIDLLQGSGQVYLLDATTPECSSTNCLQTRRHLYLRNGPFILKLSSGQIGIQHAIQVHLYQIGHTLQVTPVISIELATHVDFVDFLQITGFIQRKQSQFTRSCYVDRNFHGRFGHKQTITPVVGNAISMETAVGYAHDYLLARQIRTSPENRHLFRQHAKFAQAGHISESTITNVFDIFGQSKFCHTAIVAEGIVLDATDRGRQIDNLQTVLAVVVIGATYSYNRIVYPILVINSRDGERRGIITARETVKSSQPVLFVESPILTAKVHGAAKVPFFHGNNRSIIDRDRFLQSLEHFVVSVRNVLVQINGLQCL